MIALLAMLACTGGVTSSPEEVAPVEIGLAECAVCGMVVGEQPSPRGQLAYRDGSHAHTCSIEEARALAGVPDGRGKPIGVWVEALPSDFDWTATDVDPLPWVDAREAHFVFGADRKLVMGVPVLSYADGDLAAQAAESLGTRPVTWTELVQTPVPDVPEKAGWKPSEPRRPR